MGSIIGAMCGVIFAVFANFVVLPHVLRQQSERLSGDRVLPLLGWDIAKVQTVTRFIYRWWMPVFFTVMGAIFGYQIGLKA